MAYSLNDLYASLRVVMRLNGFLLGLLLGLLLLIFPHGWFTAWGIYDAGPVWPHRLVGALLIALGVILLLAAQERMVSSAVMLGMTIANGLMALVLLIAYMQGEFAALQLSGRIFLVAIVLLCLISAIAPLRFLRSDSGLL